MIDLQMFDEKAAPSMNGQKATAAELADGDYDFEISRALVKVTSKQKTAIFTMDVKVISQGPCEGAIVERPSFLTSQDSFNILLADLKRLGFDSDQWTRANDRPASAEIEKALRLLPGLRFKGSKKTNGNYHNIYINERMNDDGQPATFGPAELDAAGAADADPF